MMYLVICVVILAGLWFRSRIEVGRLQKQLKAAHKERQQVALMADDDLYSLGQSEKMWRSQAKLYAERAEHWHKLHRELSEMVERAEDEAREQRYQVSNN